MSEAKLHIFDGLPPVASEFVLAHIEGWQALMDVLGEVNAWVEESHDLPGVAWSRKYPAVAHRRSWQARRRTWGASLVAVG